VTLASIRDEQQFLARPPQDAGRGVVQTGVGGTVMAPSTFACLVEERSATAPFAQTAWVTSRDMGGAISKALKAASESGFTQPAVVLADPCSIKDLPGDGLRHGRGIIFSSTRFTFPPTKTFEFPFGIVPSYAEGEGDPDRISTGFKRRSKRGLTEIELCTAGSSLLPDYLALLRQFRRLKACWVCVHAHWQRRAVDVLYANERLRSASSVAALLTAEPASFLRNGFVTFTAYSSNGATNISITDHKLIVVLTRSPQVADRVQARLERRGVRQTRQLATIEHGVHHWHFKDPRAPSRARYIQMIRNLGFKRWRTAPPKWPE